MPFVRIVPASKGFFMKNEDLKLVPRRSNSGKVNYDLSRGDIVIASLVWTKWVMDEGYQYCPATTARGFSRVLRGTVRETLIKAGRLKAAVADELIANAPELDHDGVVAA
jgi:hypothetical protein